jgi:hypothetical protein
MVDSSPNPQFLVRGRKVRVDENGLACLNDIWTAAGFTKNQRPSDWMRLQTTLKRIERVLKLNTGKFRDYDKTDMHKVYRIRRGTDSGTYADIRLALDYAEYLNPALAIEVKETFLRAKAGDPTLADEVLQKATPQGNKWAGVRALARANRNQYTDVLKEHGVQDKGYMECTEAVYQNLLGGRSFEIRNRRGLPPKANLRDNMSVDELSYVMAAEALSAERIAEEDRRGNAKCAEASAIGARAIKAAIDADRRNRQQRMIS